MIPLLGIVFLDNVLEHRSEGLDRASSAFEEEALEVQALVEKDRRVAYGLTVFFFLQPDLRPEQGPEEVGDHNAVITIRELGNCYHESQRKREGIPGKTNTGGRRAAVPLRTLSAVVAVAGEDILREHPAHSGLVFIRLHEVPPGPAPAQALDGGQVGPCAVLNGGGLRVENRSSVVEGEDFPLCKTKFKLRQLTKKNG